MCFIHQENVYRVIDLAISMTSENRMCQNDKQEKNSFCIVARVVPGRIIVRNFHFRGLKEGRLFER